MLVHLPFISSFLLILASSSVVPNRWSGYHYQTPEGFQYHLQDGNSKFSYGYVIGEIPKGGAKTRKGVLKDSVKKNSLLEVGTKTLSLSQYLLTRTFLPECESGQRVHVRNQRTMLRTLNCCVRCLGTARTFNCFPELSCERISVTSIQQAGECGHSNRVVGGFDTKQNEFPWQVLVQLLTRRHCSGTLITDRHVMTAAHCVRGVPAIFLSVIVGAHDLSHWFELQRRYLLVRRVTAHPDFSTTTFVNDVAILRLAGFVNLRRSTIGVACLPDITSKDYSGTIGWVSGWGSTSEGGDPSETLKKADVMIMTNNKCSQKYKDKLTIPIVDTMLCAGYDVGKKDACQGDSGGPLTVQDASGVYTVVGIVSFGVGCAKPNQPGVYTRISKYIDWIKDNTVD